MYAESYLFVFTSLIYERNEIVMTFLVCDLNMNIFSVPAMGTFIEGGLANQIFFLFFFLKNC